MNAIRHTTLMLTLAATLALPNVVRAEEAAPAAPAPDTAVTAPAQDAPAILPGTGAGMGMQHGGIHGDHCKTNRGAMTGDGKPCMTGQGCRLQGADAMTEKRLDMLEKRMDMMQMVLEMMVRQSVDTSQ